MSIPSSANPLLLAGGTSYTISRSVRLRSSASASFNRTPASSTDRTKFTISTWIKQAALGVRRTIAASGSAGGDTGAFIIRFETSDKLLISGGSTTWRLSTQLFRDPTAHGHLVVAFDTTNATAANRIRAYWNGVEITTWDTNANPAQNLTTAWNFAQTAYIGYDTFGATYSEEYLSEFYNIDGQALTPSSFGEFDSITGVWKPKKFSGTYGTNGFYLNFSDNSAVTAAAIGKDSSGNGNNWTPSGISISAGVTYDSMIDVPTPYTDGGNGRGNYCVISPLEYSNSWTYAPTTLYGNLSFQSPQTASQIGTAYGTVATSTGKYYFEVTLDAVVAGYSASIGITDVAHSGLSALLNVYTSASSSSTSLNGTQQQTGLSAFSVGDVIGVAYDLTSGTVQFYRNGTTFGNAISTLTSDTYLPFFYGQTSSAGGRWSLAANFGQRPFSYTPPTGYVALNTNNLPTPSIKKGASHMNIALDTGANINATATAMATNDLIWIKDRANANNHQLIDTSRGSTAVLVSNSTTAELTYTTPTGNSVAWGWKKGATPGFDIVTYTGDGQPRTIAHSLGAAPAMIFVKARNAAYSWATYHKSIGNTNALYLDSTGTVIASSSFWNNTSPTSSVFSVNYAAQTNNSGTTYVAYLFAEVPGFSKFGSYGGNGSADGMAVNLGFRPRFIMLKGSNVVSPWLIIDTSRDTTNVAIADLVANTTAAENTANVGADIDVLACGFKIRSASFNNASGQTYIYAAFAENPFKYALAR